MAKSDAVKIAELQMKRDVLASFTDLAHNRVAQGIAGVLAVNILRQQKYKDQPLIDEKLAGAMNVAIFAYMAVPAATEVAKILQPWILPAAAAAGGAAATRAAPAIRTLTGRVKTGVKQLPAAVGSGTVTLLPPPPDPQYIQELKSAKKDPGKQMKATQSWFKRFFGSK